MGPEKLGCSSFDLLAVVRPAMSCFFADSHEASESHVALLGVLVLRWVRLKPISEGVLDDERDCVSSSGLAAV